MNKQEHLMTVFAEELGEVATELLDLQKQVFKALRFGIDEQRDLPTSNRDRINAEWQDLLGCVEKLREVGIELKPDITEITAKMNKVEKYCDYAKSIGTITDGGNKMQIINNDEIDAFLFEHKDNGCIGIKGNLLDKEGYPVNIAWRDKVTGEEIPIQREC